VTFSNAAECLILGEITCSSMIVVLNKIDSFPENAREKSIEKVEILLTANRTWKLFELRRNEVKD